MTVRRGALYAASGLGASLLLVVGIVAALQLSHTGVLPGVHVGDVALGGLSEAEAREELAELNDRRRAETVTVSADGYTFTLDPADVELTIDIDATMEQALAPGRTGNVLASSWDHVAALWRDLRIEPTITFDADGVAAWVATIAAEIDDDPFPGAIHVSATTFEVTTEPPGPGHGLDRDATVAAVMEALVVPGEEIVEVEVSVTEPRIDPGDVERLADVARDAVAEPLIVTANAVSVTLEPVELAPLIRLREVQDGDAWTVELAVAPDLLEETLGERAGAFEVAPVEARFDIPREPPVTHDDKDDTTFKPVPVTVGVVPSQPGETFDAELAAVQVGELLTEGRRAGGISLRPVEPEFTTEDARAYNLGNLIGTFTTYHACCASRVTNIQLLADLVDGTVVEPGEQFSVNQISGERTCTRGFRPAGMILNGELVDVCGGGVSQFGTTMFNAAFFAGLPIDQYKAHSWFISRYPMGREATLNYPSPDIDVRWTNTTDSGILVRTSYTGTSITVSLFGDNGGLEVSAIHGGAHNYRGFSTEVREDGSLPPGTERTLQGGAQGFDVTVVRVIKHADGREEREEFFTRYTPIRRIVARNSTAAPPPEPEPEPDPGPEPEPEPESGQ